MVNTSCGTQSGVEGSWLVDGMLRIGHRCLVSTLEGGCKTLLVCWIAVCVANGFPKERDFEPTKRCPHCRIEKRSRYGKQTRGGDRYAA
jgi:hypothetical protein